MYHDVGAIASRILSRWCEKSLTTAQVRQAIKVTDERVVHYAVRDWVPEHPQELDVAEAVLTALSEFEARKLRPAEARAVLTRLEAQVDQILGSVPFVVQWHVHQQLSGSAKPIATGV